MIDILSVIEAILFAAGESVPVARLSLILGVGEDEVLAAAEELREKYEREQRGMRILRLDDRLQMCSAPEFAPYISKALEQRKPPMLSALSTLRRNCAKNWLRKSLTMPLRALKRQLTSGQRIRKSIRSSSSAAYRPMALSI